MTWDAYNRRKEVLHEVLAIAEQHRGESAAQILAGIEGADPSARGELELLMDAQMMWFQLLSSHMDRNAFLGDSDFETVAIESWHSAADEAPALRHLLDDNVDLPALQPAFRVEHEFLARAAGVAPDHVGLAHLGRDIKEKAFSTKVYIESIPDNPAGILARIREALAA